MPDVKFNRTPKSLIANPDEQEQIGSRLGAAKEEAKKRLKDQGFDDNTIGMVLSSFDDLEASEQERAQVMEDIDWVQTEQPYIEQEPDYLGNILGSLLQGVGQRVGYKFMTKG